MSKFTTIAATTQSLAPSAGDEASRLGAQQVDIDHLFVAMVVNEQSAGQVLRRLGITLDGARTAVAEQHAEQLGELGIHAAAPEPGPITLHERSEFSFSERAMALLNRSGEGDKRGDAAAILRELVDEPSGLIAAVLQRLETTPDAVRALLDDVDQLPARPTPRAEPGAIASVAESFVPASVADVWALLVDPQRMGEWLAGYTEATDAPTEVVVGSSWLLRTRNTDDHGAPVKVKPERRQVRVEVTELVVTHTIEWTIVWPDEPKANVRRLRIDLEPSGDGTHLTTRQAWEPRSGVRRRPSLMRWVLRPLHRFATWMQVSHAGTSIGRVFR